MSLLPEYLPDAVITDVGDAILGDDTMDPEDFAIVAAALTDLALNDTHTRVAVSPDFEGRDLDELESAVDIVALSADYYYGNYYTGY